MNKEELVQVVAEKTEMSKRDVNAIISTIIDSIQDAMVEGQKVTLVGFGTFSIRNRAARTGHNPRTGEAINIPAKNVPVFAAGKTFRERMQ